MNFPFEDFGLNSNNLYEILATTYNISTQKFNLMPNTSCMGIRFTEKGDIRIYPYPTTSTFKNLKQNGLLVVNFIDNIYLYALAALKGNDSPLKIKEFPKRKYEILKLPFPIKLKNSQKISKISFIKGTWGLLLCKSFLEKKLVKKTHFGPLKISEFILKVIHSKKLRESYKLYNRAENLSLELIIIATRLKVAYEQNHQEIFKELDKRANHYIKEIKRFGMNKESLNTVNLVEEYISYFK